MCVMTGFTSFFILVTLDANYPLNKKEVAHKLLVKEENYILIMLLRIDHTHSSFIHLFDV
jgi:hypothetical protein